MCAIICDWVFIVINESTGSQHWRKRKVLKTFFTSKKRFISGDVISNDKWTDAYLWAKNVISSFRL